ncbi:MAG: hypothetical protein WCD53_15305 [Microcoleus sp.]
MQASKWFVHISIICFLCDRFLSKGDRTNDKDEPPDTGMFARLPGPKPPKFPPRVSQPQLDRKSTTTRPQVSLSQLPC